MIRERGAGGRTRGLAGTRGGAQPGQRCGCCWVEVRPDGAAERTLVTKWGQGRNGVRPQDVTKRENDEMGPDPQMPFLHLGTASQIRHKRHYAALNRVTPGKVAAPGGRLGRARAVDQVSRGWRRRSKYDTTIQRITFGSTLYFWDSSLTSVPDEISETSLGAVSSSWSLCLT